MSTEVSSNGDGLNGSGGEGSQAKESPVSKLSTGTSLFGSTVPPLAEIAASNGDGEEEEKTGAESQEPSIEQDNRREEITAQVAEETGAEAEAPAMETTSPEPIPEEAARSPRVEENMDEGPENMEEDAEDDKTGSPDEDQDTTMPLVEELVSSSTDKEGEGGAKEEEEEEADEAEETAMPIVESPKEEEEKEEEEEDGAEKPTEGEPEMLISETSPEEAGEKEETTAAPTEESAIPETELDSASPEGLTVAEDEAEEATSETKTPTARAKKMSRKESAKKAAAARIAKAQSRKAAAEMETDESKEEATTEGSKETAATPASSRRSARLSRTPAKAASQTPTPASTRGKRKAAEAAEAAVEAKTPRRSSGRARKPSSVAMEAEGGAGGGGGVGGGGESETSSGTSTPLQPRPKRRPQPLTPASEPTSRRQSPRAARATAAESTPIQRKSATKKTASERKPKAAKKSGGAEEDPFDFEAQADVSPEPLKNISMAASSHGAATYTTSGGSAPKGQSRFAFTAAVTSRKSLADTLPIEKTRVSSGSGGAPRGFAKGSPPTSGSMADVSSGGLSKSSGGSGAKPRSTPSSKSRSSKDSLKGLFSDINENLEEAEAAAAAPKTTPAKKSATPKAKAASTPLTTPKESPSKKVPILNAEEQLEADQPDKAAVHLLAPGARVLAKWPTDKCFYPAWVLSNNGVGTLKLKFWDGPIRQAPFPDIIPLGALAPSATLMKVKGEEIQPVTISAHPSHTDAAEWKAGMFQVDNLVTEASEELHWESMMIDKEQTKDFVSSGINYASQEVSTHNIAASRQRQTRRSTGVAEAAEATTPKTPKTPKTRAKAATAPVAETTKAEAYFAGLSFVLTSANRKAKAEDGEEERPPAFNKKRVRQIIEEGGGRVVEELGGAEPISYLVADTHYRTHKYLAALARAIPTVSHQWILDSVEAGRALPHANYVLPAGVGLELGRLMEWHDHCPSLLRNWRVLVHTENRPAHPSALDFVQIWSPLVEAMGARRVAEAAELAGGEEESRLLLTDASCGAGVLTAAAAANASAVSSEWLIQAIITGRLPEPGAHPKYRYDYVESALPSAPQS